MHQKSLTVASRGFFRRAALLAACLISGAQATTYTINSNTMALTNDATCGFREALDAINSGVAKWGCPAPSAPNTINLSALTYTVPAGLSLTQSVSINCPSGTCIVDVGSLSTDLFSLYGGNSLVVSISKLTLRQTSGNPNGCTGVAVQGGTLKLQETTITGFKWAGLSIQTGSNHEIQRSTFTGNRWGILLLDGTTTQSTSNTISNNATGIVAGAVTGFSDNGSVISNNSGAGIEFINIGGSIYLTNTKISGNKNRGISLNHSTNAHLTHCTIERNTTPGDGAGMYIPADFAGSAAFVKINSSTISNNRAQGNGGGLYVSGTCDVQNSTLSNDTAARGGGAYSTNNSSNSYLWLTHSTVAFNRATVSGGGVMNVPQAGDGRVTVSGSIIARNSAQQQHPDMSGPTVGASSLFGDLTGATGDYSDDLPAGDPLLGALADNAGPNRIKTHALLPGSPAINKVHPSLVFTTDARGFPRPTASLSWDAGAYEVMPFETELLTVIASQGWHATQVDAGLSNGAGTIIRSGAIGNYVTYAVAIPEAVSTPPGTKYKIEIGAITSQDGAIVELATAPGTSDFTRIGEVDLYTSTKKPSVLPLTFNFTSPGIKHFRLKITGRNPANTFGYFCFFDYIKITKQ
jgi:hypothetical protein